MNPKSMIAEEGYAVGRLIAFALRSSKPTREGEYKDLIDQYIYEESFREAVDQVLEGLGLRVLNDTTLALRAGLVLSCTGHSSPFAPNLDSHARGLAREQRLALGIIHLAILCHYYPQADIDEEEDDFRSRAGTASEIAETINQLCETMKHSRGNFDTEDLPGEQIFLAFESYLAMPPAPTKATQTPARSTQVGLVLHALSELQRNGFLSTDGGEGIMMRFVSLPKYRVYVRSLSGHELVKLIRMVLQNLADGQQPADSTASNEVQETISLGESDPQSRFNSMSPSKNKGGKSIHSPANPVEEED